MPKLWRARAVLKMAKSMRSMRNRARKPVSRKKPTNLPKRITMRITEELFRKISPVREEERKRLGLSKLSLNDWCIKVLENATRPRVPWTPVDIQEVVTVKAVDEYHARKQEALDQLTVVANVAERLADPNACAKCGALLAPYEVDGKRYCSRCA